MVRRKRDFFEWEFTKKMNAVGRLSSSDGIHFVAISPFEKISPRSTITMELAGRLRMFCELCKCSRHAYIKKSGDAIGVGF